MKKAYSVLSNATAFVKTSGIDPCNQPTPPEKSLCNGGFDSSMEYKDELVKILAPIKTGGCDYGNLSGYQVWHGISSGCVGGGNTIYTDLSGKMVSARNIDRRILLLKDGTVVYFGGLDMPGLTLTVDVNGIAGPNILSKDLFVFSLTNKGLKPYGSPGTENPYFTGYAGFSCDEYSGIVDGGTGRVGTIFFAKGAGCTAKYLLE